MAITAETRTDIIELVVGMFDAAPGATVLSELAVAVDAGVSLKDLAITLGNSSVFTAEYPAFLTNQEFATKYLTSFLGGNPGEVSEANFTLAVDAVVALLNAGKSRGEVVYDVVTAVSAVAETDANFGTAAARLNNQTEVAIHYSVTTQQSGDTLDDLKAVIVNVTSADATVTAAKDVIDGTNNAGGSFTLTTGVDSLTGTTGNDTFTGVIDDNTAANNSVGTADTVDGGAGTDVFNIIVDTSGAGVALPASNITNIENFFFRNVSGQTLTVDANTITGEQQLWADRASAAVTINNIASGTTVGIKGDSTTTNAAVTANHGATVTSGTLAIDGDTTASAVTVSGASMSTLSITSTGGTNKLTSLAAAAATKTLNITATTGLDLGTGTTGLAADTTVTVTGAGAVDLGSNAQVANVDTIDASGNSGGVTVHLDDEVTDKFTGSTGNDTVTAGSTAFTAASTGFINGGDGTDTLVLDNATVVGTAASGGKISNFESVSVVKGLTVDFDNIAANNTIAALSIQADGNTTSINNNLNAATAGNVTIVDGGTGVLSNVTLAVKGADTVGQLDTVKVTLSDSTPGDLIDVDNFIIADVETLEIVASTAGTSVVSALTHQDWSKLNISGSGPLSITTAAGASQVNTAVDGSAATGALTLNFGASTTNGMAITGGSGKDTITGTGQNDVIKGGAGADSITGGVGLDTMTGGDGADTFVFANTATGLPSATAFDTITDFAKGSDKIDGPAALTISVSGTASAGTAAINAEGIASFAAADDTLAEKLTAVAAGVEVATATTANDIAIFEHGSDSYVFISDATAGLSATDVLIKLTGVTGLNDSTITAGDLTIA